MTGSSHFSVVFVAPFKTFFFFFLVLVEKRMIKQYLPLHKLLLGISVPCWTLRSIEMTVGKKSGYDLIRMLDYKGFLQY